MKRFCISHTFVSTKRSSKEADELLEEAVVVFNFPRKKERKKDGFAKSSMSFTTRSRRRPRERETRESEEVLYLTHTFVSNDV